MVVCGKSAFYISHWYRADWGNLQLCCSWDNYSTLLQGVWLVYLLCCIWHGLRAFWLNTQDTEFAKNTVPSLHTHISSCLSSPKYFPKILKKTSQNRFWSNCNESSSPVNSSNWTVKQWYFLLCKTNEQRIACTWWHEWNPITLLHS